MHLASFTPRMTEETALLPGDTAEPAKAHRVRPTHVVAAVALAVVATALAATGFALWHRAEFFQMNDAARTARGLATGQPFYGYTPTQWVGLLLFVLFGPWVLLWALAGHALSVAYAPRQPRFVPLVLCLIVAVAFTVVSAVEMTGDLWACGVAFCFDPAKHAPPSADRSHYIGDGWMTTTGLAITFVSFAAAVAFARALFTANRCKGCTKAAKGCYTDVMAVDWLVIGASLCLLVAMFLFTLYLPNTFQAFTPSALAASASTAAACVRPAHGVPANASSPGAAAYPTTCPELPWAAHMTRSHRISAHVYWNFFPGNVIVYVYLFTMLLFGALLHSTRSSRRFMGKRIPILRSRGWAVTPAQLLAYPLTIVMATLFGVYWLHDHNFANAYNAGVAPHAAGLTRSDRWARGLGQLAVAIFSLLFFPVARTSIVHRALGSNWVSLLTFHKFLGYAFLAAMVGHVGAWWKEFISNRPASEGAWPRLVFSIPYRLHDYDVDNFTIPLAFAAAVLLLLCMGLLALPPVRRRAFEVFYWSHLVAAYASIPVILWHATAGWQYMLPGLTVYLLDRFIRLSRSGAHVPNAVVTLVSDEVLEIRWKGAIAGFQPGQHIFVSVPAVSLFEWHPFSLSSNPHDIDDVRTLHVKRMGEGSWTARLHKIAESGLGKPVPIDLWLDGPVGSSNLHLEDYDAVVLVAGGIGVTPCTSIAHSLLREGSVMAYLQGGKAATPSGQQAVSLLWVVRDGRALADSLKIPPARPPTAHTVSMGLASFTVRGFETAPKNEDGPWTLASLKGWSFTKGRPASGLDSEIKALVPHHAECVLVFACGPTSLVDDARCAADAHGYHFVTEGFEL